MPAYASPRGQASETDRQPLPTERVLELLGDEYTRRVLAAISEEALSVREVAETTAVSRTTAHRRLTELRDAGLAESRTQLHPDGHHRAEFESVVEEANLDINDDGLDVRITTTSGQRVDGTVDP